MEFKSYYGSTIREALQRARQELGVDAAILASRQVEAGEGLPGRYEVVCGLVPAMQSSPRGAAPKSTPAMSASTPPPVARRIPAPTPEVAKPVPAPEPVASMAPSTSPIRKRINSIREAIMPGKSRNDGGLKTIQDQLTLDGFSANLAAEIVSGVKRRLPDTDPETALIRELDARAAIDASLGRSSAPRKITALVGPQGVGKSSLIIKLAVRYGLTGRKPLRLVTLDGGRVGGADALSVYAAGMGVPIDVLETGTSLAQTLEAHPEAGLILIDTPGLSPGDFAAAAEWTTVLSKHPEIDVQLVVSAMMSPSDLQAAYDRFRPLLPSRIAVNYTDSAASCRAAVGLALRNEIPLSFAGTGSSIPEDMTEFHVASLLRPEAETRPKKSAVTAA